MGNIGTGKTTFIDRMSSDENKEWLLKHGFDDVIVIKELDGSDEEKALLEAIYSENATTHDNFKLQMHLIKSKLRRIEEASMKSVKEKKSSLLLVDVHPVQDLVYFHNIFKRDKHSLATLIKEWGQYVWKLWLLGLIRGDVYFYGGSTERIEENIKTRNRPFWREEIAWMRGLNPAFNSLAQSLQNAPSGDRWGVVKGMYLQEFKPEWVDGNVHMQNVESEIKKCFNRIEWFDRFGEK